MSSPTTYGVFISYSHEDAKLVTPLVRLLRYERDDLIFHDKNDIRDGEQWEPQLLQRLGEVHTVMVFWCKHSAQSEYVRKEYLQGIAQQKKILPIILDETKMTSELAAFQGIDFRESAIHPSVNAELWPRIPPAYAPAPSSPVPPSSAPKTYRSNNSLRWFVAVLCVVAVAFIFISSLPWWVYLIVLALAAAIFGATAVMSRGEMDRPVDRKAPPVIKRLDKQLQEANISPDFPRPLAQQVLQRLNEMMPAT